MTQAERESRWSIVVAYCWRWAALNNSVYMCAPFYHYARAIGLMEA